MHHSVCMKKLFKKNKQQEKAIQSNQISSTSREVIQGKIIFKRRKKNSIWNEHVLTEES